MRKLFTKSLACVIALTLCLTAFVGAVSVSAATKNATITVVDQEITQGTETVTVPVTITCDADVAINEAILIISSDLGAVTAIADADVNDEAAVESVGDIKDKVFVAARSEGYSVAKLNVTFAVAADKAVGDYNINIDVEGVKAADYSENVVTLVYDGAGKVTVKVAGPVEDETLAAGITQRIYVDSSIGIKYEFDFYNWTAAGNAYDDFEYVITRKTYNNDDYAEQDATVVTYNRTNADTGYGEYDFFEATYVGITMYEMNVDIYATLNMYKDGEIVATYTMPKTSIKELALQNFTSATRDDTKYLMVDLLNVGAAAQEYFGKEGTDLHDVELANVGADQNYATVNYGELVDSSSAAGVITPALKLAGSPVLQYTVDFYGVIADENLPAAADLTFKSSYYSKAKGENTELVALGTDPAIDSSLGEYGYYTFTFEDIALYDADKVVTTEVILNAGTAEETVLATNTYSVETFISKNINSAVAGELLQALASFGASARVFWPNY